MNKIKTIFCVLAIAGFVGQAEGAFIDHEQEFLQRPEKLAEWESMSQQVNSWTDKLGKPVDENIKETVIVLNLLGLKTVRSCEGHLDSGCSYPWVDMDLSNPHFDELSKKHDELLMQIKSEAKKDNLSESEQEALNALIQDRRAIADEIDLLLHEKIDPIHQLFTNYYQEHSTSYERTLYVLPFRLARMRSLGSDFMGTLQSAEKAEKLQQLQDEMGKFTDYLIVQYLNR